jgi:catabolite regulation protein CreA
MSGKSKGKSSGDWKRGGDRSVSGTGEMAMKAEKSLVAFEDHKIRRVYDEKSGVGIGE